MEAVTVEAALVVVMEQWRMLGIVGSVRLIFSILVCRKLKVSGASDQGVTAKCQGIRDHWKTRECVLNIGVLDGVVVASTAARPSCLTPAE